jgi:hypothetical protein
MDYLQMSPNRYSYFFLEVAKLNKFTIKALPASLCYFYITFCKIDTPLPLGYFIIKTMLMNITSKITGVMFTYMCTPL